MRISSEKCRGKVCRADGYNERIIPVKGAGRIGITKSNTGERRRTYSYNEKAIPVMGAE